jgi:hypothetical protein
VAQEQAGSQRSQGAAADAAVEKTAEPAEPAKLELVSKKTEDGRIITRYRSFDFNDMRSLYENFKKRPAVVGAAIIRDRELIKVLGRVPAAEGAKQLDVLLGASRQVLEKPSLDFISANPILNSLYELANGDFRLKDYNVVLFKDSSGRPEILPLPDRRGYSQVKTPLSEFKIAKIVHDRFKSENALIGASVIGETGPSAPPPRAESKHGKDKDRDRGNRPDFRSRQPSRSSSVVAAFGKTPLKQNVLLSAEILKRLGVDLSIL